MASSFIRGGDFANESKPTPPVVDRQLVTFSCFAKEKVTKKKATPVCRPCGVPCAARLVRLPHKLARSATRPRAQTYSSEFPDQPALLGGAQGMKNGNPKPRKVGTMCPPFADIRDFPLTTRRRWSVLEGNLLSETENLVSGLLQFQLDTRITDTQSDIL